MASHATRTLFVIVTAVALGAAAAALFGGWDGGGTRNAAADLVEDPDEAGASGESRLQEAVAVSAVQAHLRNARVEGQLFDLRLYPRPQPDEVIVCGMVPMPGGPPMQVVAKVILTRAASVAQGGPTAPRIGDTMVVMEAGPGLGRGGSQAGPALRYCRDSRDAAQTEATPVAADQHEPDTASAPTSRVMVVAPARIRAGPSTGGAILGTTQRQQSYVVLDAAPGGWILLGNGQASLGWAHSSLFAPVP